MAAPVGAVFPAESSVFGLYGRILEDGEVEYGYLVFDEDGDLRWVNQTDAALEAST